MARHIRDLGSFESIQQVWTALPGGGMEGDYLTINGNPFAWNKYIRQWQNDTTVINNPARETQTHDGDMNIGNDARIGGNLVVIGNIINDSIKNGLSAFELAVKGGYQGTEEQWLNSLIGKSAYQIWLEQAGNAGKNMTQFLAWMKDTQAIRGPKYIGDESLIDTVNDRMTLFYVPSGTSYKVVFVDEGGGTHTLANRIGDITNYAGIYDVSADNEDNGVIPSYGTLSEAIADISQAAKKAGMTIKYKDSDGKYHQYRYLLADTTDNDKFTDEDNWEADNSIGIVDVYNESDLEIGGKKGNVLVRFANGDIETKNFNSNKEQQNTGTSNFVVFDEYTNYSIGDTVKYEGLLYKFIAIHNSGAWNENDVEQTSIWETIPDLEVADINTSDFEVADDKNNVVFRIAGGDFETKNFKSKYVNYYRYTTFIPKLIGGNPISTGNENGTVVTFGASETNALKMLHSKIYNILPKTTISIYSEIVKMQLKLIFIDDEYKQINVSTVHEITDADWNGCSVAVPDGACKVILQVNDAQDENDNRLHDCDLQVIACINTINPTSYFPRTSNGYQHLTMKVSYASITNSHTPTNELITESQYYVDNGVLCLPETYTPDGEPTRLICFTHGHGVTYNNSSTAFDSLDIKPELWLSEGYAIFDMDGSVTGTFGGNHEFEPAVVNAYDTAYEWIVRHYNIRTDGVFSAGRSQGGATQFILAKRSKMPILAFAPIVPVVSPIGYFGRSHTRAAKKELLAAYGVPNNELNSVSWAGSGNVYFHQLTTEIKQLIIDNQYRFNAYTPFCYNRTLTIEEAEKYSLADIPKTDVNYNETVQNEYYEQFYASVSASLNPSAFNNKPFIMFTCVSDNVVNHKGVEMFHKLLADAGQLVQIHVFTDPVAASPGDTDHRFEINSENLITYTNSKGITLDDVPKVYIEILAFWRRFENQDQNID